MFKNVKKKKVLIFYTKRPMEFVANSMGLSPMPSLLTIKSRFETAIRPTLGPNNTDLRRSVYSLALVRLKQSYIRDTIISI